MEECACKKRFNSYSALRKHEGKCLAIAELKERKRPRVEPVSPPAQGVTIRRGVDSRSVDAKFRDIDEKLERLFLAVCFAFQKLE
jgi:hypothetical protein